MNRRVKRGTQIYRLGRKCLDIAGIGRKTRIKRSIPRRGHKKEKKSKQSVSTTITEGGSQNSSETQGKRSISGNREGEKTSARKSIRASLLQKESGEFVDKNSFPRKGKIPAHATIKKEFGTPRRGGEGSFKGKNT